MGIKRGIIQSRGLGDIVIALPIARYYADQGDEIIWPICEEFLPSVQAIAPWVTWIGVETDKEGRFFLDTPLQVLQSQGCDLDSALYLYQYLSARPDLTDPELFNILKFDQYKYQVSGVPFIKKWQLRDCIVRDPAVEDALREALGIKPGDRYAVTHFKGSSFEARVDVTWLDPEVRLIDVDAHATDSVFDWIGVLEGAEAIICIDSVVANLVDQLCIEGDLYWIRRSAWDLTPVLGMSWTIVPTNLPIQEPKRVDPAVAAKELEARVAAAQRPAGTGQGVMQSHAPYAAAGGIPTNFMHAVRQDGSTGNIQGAPTAQPSQPKLNTALDLYKTLGVKY